MAKRHILTASELGRKGGLIGGRVRMSQFKSQQEHSAFARAAVQVFWNKLDEKVPQPGPWLRTGAAAARLKVSIGTLRNLAVERKLIPFRRIRMGRRQCRIFHEADLVAYLKEHSK